ncbi:ABC transporter ATP-binding protein [Pelagibacteraceae bacterium]|nr:ABC transporter ATP-binding protein [Pelagibacteraceae bacterium]
MDHKRKMGFIFLFCLIVINSVLEIFGVLSVIPFINIAIDSKSLTNEYLVIIQEFTKLEDKNFIFFLGFFVFLIFSISSVISLITIWFSAKYSYNFGAFLSYKLFNNYLFLDLNKKNKETSTELTKKITIDCKQVTVHILLPIIIFFSKVILIILFLIILLMYNPRLSIICFMIYFLSYIFIYKILKNRIKFHGKKINQSQSLISKITNESFKSFYEIVLYRKYLYFLKKFDSQVHYLANSIAKNQVYQLMPRVLIEFLAIGTIVVLLNFFIYYEYDKTHVISSLAFFGVAGFKLLPAFQQIYYQYSVFKSNLPHFFNIKDDIFQNNNSDNSVDLTNKNLHQKIYKNFKSIIFKDVKFSYNTYKVFDNLNLKIFKNNKVIIVGDSGRGKSTFISLFLGLREPENGKVILNGETLNNFNIKRSWQDFISYVPQNIFLMDCSINENITFEKEFQNIDVSYYNKITKLCLLEEIIKDKSKEHVGEDGLNLSGGQKQRVGIARALYQKRPILVIDEGLNSVDTKMERQILKNIIDLEHIELILFVTHRLDNADVFDKKIEF